MTFCSIASRLPENCQVYLLAHVISWVAMTLLVIGLIGHYQVGALAGVNAMSSISLITSGSILTGLECMMCVVVLLIKKDRPLSHFEFQQWQHHIKNGEWVEHYSLNNPNSVEIVYRGSNGTLQTLNHKHPNQIEFNKLTLRDLKRRNGEHSQCSPISFFLGDS